MRERIKNKQISKEVKAMLPVISEENFKERGCSYCPYYAGTFEKMPRCLMAECAWDNEDERFHPALREMLPDFKARMEKAKAKYEEALQAYDTLFSMFKDEMKQEELEKDECFGCSYSKGTPCVGICYEKLMGGKK